MQVKQRYHHVFNHNLSTGATFSSDVYVPFIPDEMIVRLVSYNGVNGNETDKNILVWCNMINDIIAITSDTSAVCPQSVFNIGKSASGTWSFELRKIDGELVNTTNTGKELSILVEFVKY